MTKAKDFQPLTIAARIFVEFLDPPVNRKDDW